MHARSFLAVIAAVVALAFSSAGRAADGSGIPLLPGTLVLRLEPMPPNLEHQLDSGLQPARFGVPELDAIAEDVGVTAISRVCSVPRWQQLGPVDVSTILTVAFSTEQDVARVVGRFANAAGVAYAQPESERLPACLPDDPQYLVGNQRYLDSIGAPAAWCVKTSGPVVVVISDLGCPDASHPDLNPSWWGPLSPIGIDDHATKVAGIAAAATNNAEGVASIGWSATGGPGNTPVQVNKWACGGLGEAISVAAAGSQDVTWNMSMVTGISGPATRELVNEALLHGIVPCVSAANWNANTENAHAVLPGVLCVGAVTGCTSQHVRSYLSAFGEAVDLMAPGDGCMTTTQGPDIYNNFTGTSAASPVVAGLAALVRSLHPAWTADEIERHLEGTAQTTDDDEANRCWYSLMGTGTIDAARAMDPDGNGDPLDDYESVPSLRYEWVQVIDDGTQGTTGNGNGAAEAGETVGLLVHVVNRYGATTPAMLLIADLTVNSNPVTILTPSRTFPPFGAASGPNNRKTNQQPFLVRVDSSIPYLPAELTMALTDPVSGYSTTMMFNLLLNTPGERVTGEFPYVLRPDTRTPRTATTPKTLKVARTPKPVDLDGDTTMDLLFADDDPTHAQSTPALQLNGYRMDGTVAQGWPHALTGAVNGAVAAGPMPARLGTGALVVLAEAERAAVEGINRNGVRLFRFELPRGEGRFTPPAMADLDGDGEVEIVSLLASDTSSVLHAWRAESGVPAPLPGFPIALGGQATKDMSAALADLGGDGTLEIVAACNQGSFGRVNVIGTSSCSAPGWPVSVPGIILRAPIAADLDGDGQHDIAVVTEDAVHAFAACGRPLPGWPVALPWVPASAPRFVSSLAAGDVEGDGPAEIALVVEESALPPCSNPCDVGCPANTPYRRQSAVLIGLDASGRPAVRPGFPRVIATSRSGHAQAYCVDVRGASPPNLSDVDGDGRLDLAFGERRELHVLEADGTDLQQGLIQGPIPLIPQVRASCTSGDNGPQHGYAYFYDAIEPTAPFLAPPSFVRPSPSEPAVCAFASRSRRVNLLRLDTPVGRVAWNEERSDTGNTGACPLTVTPRVPAITSVTPATFSNSNDVMVTIGGVNFTAPVDVYLGTTLMPSTLLDSNTITVLVPGGFAQGTHDVKLVFASSGCGCPRSVVQPAAVLVTGPPPFPIAGAVVWAACAGDGTAKYFNIFDNTVAAVPVGNNPWRVAIDPHRQYVFVVNRADSTVSTINATTHVEVDTCGTTGFQRVTTGPDPVGIDAGEVRGRGTVIAVACTGNVLTVFDQASATTGPCAQVEQVTLPEPALDVRMDPTGSGLAFVALATSPNVAVFDLKTIPATALPLIPVTGAAAIGRIAISSDGRFLLASELGSQSVLRVELGTTSTPLRVNLPFFRDDERADWTQRRSMGRAFITSGLDQQVAELTIDPFAKVGTLTLPAGQASGGDAVQPDQYLQVIAAGSANEVHVVNVNVPPPFVRRVTVAGEPVDAAVTTVEPAPQLTSVTPNVRRADCSLDVVVRGLRLQDTPFVWIAAGLNQVRCTVRFVSSTYLVVTVPPGLADGTYDLFLENLDGQTTLLPASFTVARNTTAAPEVRVNGLTRGAQSHTASARDPLGRTVVVWEDEPLPPNGPHAVLIKVYDSDGSVLVGDTIVNSAPSTYSADPVVAIDDFDRVAVAWTHSYSIGANPHVDVHAKWYQLNLALLRLDVIAPELAINENPYHDVMGPPLFSHTPSIAADGSGHVVITWSRQHKSMPDANNFGRRFAPGGVALAGGNGGCANTWNAEFCVASGQVGWGTDVAMEHDESGAGDFVVTWTDVTAAPPAQPRIWARRFKFVDADALGDPFVVNDDTAHEHANPSVGMDDAAGFVVAWDSRDQEPPPSGGLGVFAKRYDSNGRPTLPPPAQQRSGVGHEFQVDELVTGEQSTSDVAVDRAGRFVVAWRSALQDGSGYATLAKRYGSNGVELPTPCGTQAFGVGNELGVNTFLLSDQHEPSVAMDGTGNFAVSFTGADAAGSGVYLRRFARDGWPQ